MNSHLLVFRKWDHGIDLIRDMIKYIPIWIFLYLGFHIWLKYLYLGNPLFTDVSIAKNRGQFARACVEVSTEDDFPGKVPAVVGDHFEKIPVIYNWKPVPCSHCGVFGHES